MIQDGSGYGKSLYWEYKAQEIAVEHDEACKHILESLPKIKFGYKSNEDDAYKFDFKVKCLKCNAKFPNTEFIIRRKFLEFYGMAISRTFNDL